MSNRRIDCDAHLSFALLVLPTPGSRKVDKPLGSLTAGGFWGQIPWGQLSLEDFIVKRASRCELRGKTGLEQVKEKPKWQSQSQDDYSGLCKGTKGCGFPKRRRPAPFSSGAPLWDG